MYSRSRKAYRNGVNAPMSRPYAPKLTRCDAIRCSSAASTRIHSARGGTAMPANFSTAMAQAWLLFMLDR